MVLVGGPSAISFNTFYQLIPRGFSRLEGSIPVQLQIAYDKTSDSIKDFMTVEKAQVFPFHNSTCQHTQQIINAFSGHTACCDLCRAIRRGQGFRVDPKLEHK